MQKAVFATAMILALAPLAAQPEGVQYFSTLDGAYLGVTLAEVDSEDVASLGLEREAGARIEEVVPDSPAARADLRPGDVIVAFSGVPVLNVRQLQRLVRESPAGRSVELDLVRDGARLTLSVQLAERESRSRRWRVLPRVLRPEGGYAFRFEAPDVEPHFVFPSRERPRLGVSGVALTEQLAEALGVEGGQGVLVTEVVEDSPAKRAGLQAGDVIVSVDGETVARPAQLSSRLRRGQTHELEIVRDRVSRTLKAEIPSASTKSGSDSIRM